jgi:hypothetical protein
MYVACSLSVVVYRVDVNVESRAPLCPLAIQVRFDRAHRVVEHLRVDVQRHLRSGVTH